MDTDLQSSPSENPDKKAAFRKPSSDAATRNYRKRSPVNGSSSSDGAPEDDNSRDREYRDRKKDDEKGIGKDSGRSHYDRKWNSDRNASRGSHGHSRYDDYKHEKHADKEGRDKSRDYTRARDKYSRDKYVSSHSSKDREKEGASLEYHRYKDKESHRPEHGRQKENFGSSDRDQIGSDRVDRGEKRDQRSSLDHRSGWEKDESSAGRVDSGYLAKGHYEGNVKERENGRRTLYDSVEDGQFVRAVKALDDRSVFESEKNSPTKKPRFGPHFVKGDAGKQQTEEANGKANSAEAHANASEVVKDLNAAKFAAMKAAELVNQNLSGGGATGFLSTEQKKKLLWGNKKSTPKEESGHQWDVSLIADPERQEKFHKLMGVKGDVKAEGSSSEDRAERHKELQLDLEKQYTAGLRRRDGRTVGLGL